MSIVYYVGQYHMYHFPKGQAHPGSCIHAHLLHCGHCPCGLVESSGSDQAPKHCMMAGWVWLLDHCQLGKGVQPPPSLSTPIS